MTGFLNPSKGVQESFASGSEEMLRVVLCCDNLYKLKCTEITQRCASNRIMQSPTCRPTSYPHRAQENSWRDHAVMLVDVMPACRNLLHNCACKCAFSSPCGLPKWMCPFSYKFYVANFWITKNFVVSSFCYWILPTVKVPIWERRTKLKRFIVLLFFLLMKTAWTPKWLSGFYPFLRDNKVVSSFQLNRIIWMISMQQGVIWRRQLFASSPNNFRLQSSGEHSPFLQCVAQLQLQVTLWSPTKMCSKIAVCTLSTCRFILTIASLFSGAFVLKQWSRISRFTCEWVSANLPECNFLLKVGHCENQWLDYVHTGCKPLSKRKFEAKKTLQTGEWMCQLNSFLNLWKTTC